MRALPLRRDPGARRVGKAAAWAASARHSARRHVRVVRPLLYGLARSGARPRRRERHLGQRQRVESRLSVASSLVPPPTALTAWLGRASKLNAPSCSPLGVLLNHETPWQVEDMTTSLQSFLANTVFLGGDRAAARSRVVHQSGAFPCSLPWWRLPQSVTDESASVGPPGFCGQALGVSTHTP